MKGLERQDLPSDYRETLMEIKERILQAQYIALKTVNKCLTKMYWDIGKTIVLKQEADPESWGKSVVEQLSIDLQRECRGIKGFSPRNIWRMRNFYLKYNGNKKLTRLVSEIPWSHNIEIFQRCKDSLEREFYIRMVRKFKWSRDLLISQIKNRTFEKTMSTQTNFEITLQEGVYHQAQITVKDEYTFDFLDLGNEYDERQLENAIIRNLPSFLTEMGGVFAFIGNQYHLEVSGKEFFIDLLLFHRELGCLVAIDLKIGEFKPEYVGKMLFYLTALDEKVRNERENPPIGMILCKSKDMTIVEYTLKPANSPIGVAKYCTTKDLPNDLKGKLPGPEQIERLLKGIE